MSASATIQPNFPGQSALNARLLRIAAVAGVPVEAFFAESACLAQGGLSELLRLWEAAGTETVRAEILAGTRALVAGASHLPRA